MVDSSVAVEKNYDPEASTSSNHHADADNSNWEEFCDESVLKLLDEPFDEEMNHSRLRDDENYRGFDNNAGSTWIYPKNYPIRQYQFNITRAALFRNTLVVLPTGLGKTFIAAVVMYNIYRWYPTGKIIFMAPTKPLVAQQISACRKVTGIPMKDTAEVTGKQNKKSRRDLWNSKRVFFATPHVVQNDVNDTEQDFPFHDIRLVVVDEAHKAKGNYPHAEAVRSIASRNSNFRVLALSATPGRSVDDVMEVIRNLFISHLEIRWENSLDVMAYTHRKSMKTVVVSLGTDLAQIRGEFIDIIDPYIRYLIDNQVLSGSVSAFSRGSIVMEQKRFREMSLNHKHPNESQVKMNFSICVSLYHALELLERHGTRVFLNFFDDPSNEASQRYYVAMNPKLRQFLEKLRKYVGPNPFAVSDKTMTNGKVPDIPDDLDFGHPKFVMVKERVEEHFKENTESRVIIFCEYRESVMLMYKALLQNRPLVKPKVFVGQGGTGSIRAITQKQQLQVMEDFRSGVCNTLVATSVAEEGIDIGEVDLIICFDISTKNPTRFIQRIGRTGRRRQGSIIMMATEGKEHAIMKEVLQTKDKLNQRVVKSVEVARTLYKTSPRMVPPEFNPKCREMLMVMNDDDDKEADVSKSAKKAKPTKEPKPAKGKTKPAKKAASVPLSQDVRKFFKKVELDEEDREVFTTTTKAETSWKSFSEPNVSDPQATDLDHFLHNIEKLKKHPVNSKNTSLSHLLRNPNFSDPVKLFILTENVDYVKEKYDGLQALKAVENNPMYIKDDDEVNLQEELTIIEELIGKGKLEQFIESNSGRIETLNKLNAKYDQIFAGLETRSSEDDANDYVAKRAREIREKRKLESVSHSLDGDISNCPEEKIIDKTDIAKHETNHSLSSNEDVIDCSIENFNDFERLGEKFLEHESRYLSQFIELDRNKISDQSTPIRPAVKKDPNIEDGRPKELFVIDEFDDESDPFGIMQSQKDSEHVPCKSESLSKIEPEAEQPTLKQSNCDLFDDDFDDFFVNSKLETEVENLEKQQSSSSSVIDASNEKIENQPASIQRTTICEKATSTNEKKISPAKNDAVPVQSTSRVEIEDFDYTEFFEPFDCDDLAAIEKDIATESVKESKHFETAMENNNIKDAAQFFPEIPRQKSTELFSSNDRTLPPMNVNQEVCLKKCISPPRVSPMKMPEKSPSILSRPVNFKRLRLTGSVRPTNSSLFPNPSLVAARPGIELGNSIRQMDSSSILASQNDSPIVIQRKAKRVIDSDSEVDELPNSQTENTSFLANRQATKRRKLHRPRRCQFIDDEADDDESDHSQENTELSQMQYDSVVVVDDDIEDHPDVDMQAKYLESVRSPNKRSAFRIPAPRVYNDLSHIFSQAVPYEGNSVYKEDSFVISSDDELAEEPMSQECPLERAEAILKARRREKRNQQNGNGGKEKVNPRRGRIIRISSDDDESD